MIYKVTERYTGERDVYVEASSKAEALRKARRGDIWDAGNDPSHFHYRYSTAVEYPITQVRGKP